MLNTKHLRDHYRLIRIKQQANKISAILALTALIMLGLIAICHATPTIDLGAIAKIESSNNPKAIGDNGKAFGLYQIQQPLLIDYNKANKTRYTLKDMLDPIKAEKVATWAFTAYLPRLLRHYGKPVTVNNLLVAYNAGIGNAIKGRVPTTTKKYIAKYNKLNKGAK